MKSNHAESAKRSVFKITKIQLAQASFEQSCVYTFCIISFQTSHCKRRHETCPEIAKIRKMSEIE